MRESVCPPRRMRFSFETRCRIVTLIVAGESPAQAAAAFGASRATGYRLWVRYREGGWAALGDRPSTPLSQPRRLSPEAEQQILDAREYLAAGPILVAAAVGRPVSTVGKVLRRAGRSRLPRPQRDRRVRYERANPGELLHVDTKKLGRFFQVGKRILADGVQRSPAPAGSTSTSRSTTTAGSPTASSWRASGKRTAVPSSSAPSPGTPNTASSSNGSSPTTRRPTTRTPGERPAPSSESGAATPAPTRPGQTEKQKP